MHGIFPFLAYSSIVDRGISSFLASSSRLVGRFFFLCAVFLPEKHLEGPVPARRMTSRPLVPMELSSLMGRFGRRAICTPLLVKIDLGDAAYPQVLQFLGRMPLGRIGASSRA